MSEQKKEKENKQPTLRDRIHEVCEEYLTGDREKVDQPRFEAKIMDLIERVTHPYYFCPNCGEKMFYEINERYFRCLNCNYNSRTSMAAGEAVTPAAPATTGAPGPKMPDGVKRLINEAEQPPRVVRPTSQGDKIRKLVESRGSVPPTKEDESLIRAADPNVKGEINWS